jgi:hypothetical protein
MPDVILPCLDEAAALPWVLSRMPLGYRAIVADNGSAAIARDHGATVVDASAGPMRDARRGDLLALDLRDRRFGYPLEMVVRAAAERWRIGEVDVDYAPRTAGGKSKVTGTVRGTLRAVRDMSRVLAG